MIDDDIGTAAGALLSPSSSPLLASRWQPGGNFNTFKIKDSIGYISVLTSLDKKKIQSPVQPKLRQD